MTATTVPRRAFVLTLNLHADTLVDLVDALADVANAIADGWEPGPHISGSPSSGYVASLERNEGQTHEGYFVGLREHLAALRERQQQERGVAA